MARQHEMRRGVPARSSSRGVANEVMARVYAQVRTPYKYGIVIRGEEGKAVDCPSVFRHRGKWYMMYVCMNQVGYETHLAESDNLLAWRAVGKVLSFRKTGWDAWQAAGGVALQDPTWGGSYQLQTYNSKYWASYVGGALRGYEPDPLAIGMAWTVDPTTGAEWNRLLENPVLCPHQRDVRAFERVTLYRSNIVRDERNSSGWPFVMFYNGKGAESVERIGMAVSEDLADWRRFGQTPVVDSKTGISGDPQIARLDEVWVMFYFGAFWRPNAFDTFACSYDLVNWTKWTGPHLVEPSEPWDATYAHKPWVIKHEGVVYHFYCAVGDEGRAIAVATSEQCGSATATS